MPQCGFCQNQQFKLATIQPQGARYPLAVVVCANCDAVAGAVEQENSNETSRQAAQWVADRLREMEDRLTKKIESLQANP